MLNLLSTTPKKGVPVCSNWSLAFWTALRPLAPRFCDQDSSITALGDNGRIDHDPDWRRIDNDVVKMLTQGIHHHSEVLALQETCWVWRDLSRLDDIQVWKISRIQDLVQLATTR